MRVDFGEERPVKLGRSAPSTPTSDRYGGKSTLEVESRGQREGDGGIGASPS